MIQHLFILKILFWFGYTVNASDIPSSRTSVVARPSFFSIFSWFGNDYENEQTSDGEHWDISTASSLPSSRRNIGYKSWSFFDEGEDDLNEEESVISSYRNTSFTNNAVNVKPISNDDWFDIYRSLYQGPEQFAASVPLPHLEELFIKALNAKKIEVANILIRYGIDWRKPVYLTAAKKWVHPIAVMKKEYIRDFHDKTMVSLFQALDLNPDKRENPKLEKLQEATNSIAQELVQCMLRGDVKDCLESTIGEEDIEVNFPLYTKLKDINLSSHYAIEMEGSYRLLSEGLWLFPIDIAVILGNKQAVKTLIKKGALDHNLSMFPGTKEPKMYYLLRPRNLNLILGGKSLADNRHKIAKIFKETAVGPVKDLDLADSSAISWYKDTYPFHCDESVIEDEIAKGESCLTPRPNSACSFSSTTLLSDF